MSKADEFSKLFDLVVDHLRDPGDEFKLELMQSQKHTCLVTYGQEAMRICKDAMRYFEKQKELASV